MVRVEGTAGSCFVTLRANGSVAAAARCRDTIAVLRLAASWHWQGDDLVLLDAAGRVLALFKPLGAGHWRAQSADGPAIDLYPLVPEAQPQQT